MTREVLLTPNLGDIQTWQDFSSIIDEVFEYNIDNPLKVLLTLRDTYSYTEPTFSSQDESFYKEEIPQLIATNTYKLNNINLLDSSYERLLIKTTNTVPDFFNNSTNLPVAVIVPLGNGAGAYAPTSEFIFTLGTTLASNESLKVVAFNQVDYDVNDLINYNGDALQTGLFVINFPVASQLDINANTNLETNLPANLNTGYPYNLLIVYLRIADGSYQYLPPSSYNIVDANKIDLLVLPYNPTVIGNPSLYQDSYIRIVMRQPAVEVTKKLNQLGFRYDNIEYITRPSYVGNAYITQTMADNFSEYVFKTSGTPKFMDFFQYCSNSSFQVFKLWAQDNGDLTIYDNMTREDLLPDGYFNIYETTAGSGGWYPTSHVDLFYDIFTYGSIVDAVEVEKFFDYVAPINLVLHSIIFGGNLPLSADSKILIGGAVDIKIIYDI